MALRTYLDKVAFIEGWFMRVSTVMHFLVKDQRMDREGRANGTTTLRWKRAIELKEQFMTAPRDGQGVATTTPGDIEGT